MLQRETRGGQYNFKLYYDTTRKFQYLLQNEKNPLLLASFCIVPCFLKSCLSGRRLIDYIINCV